MDRHEAKILRETAESSKQTADAVEKTAAAAESTAQTVQNLVNVTESAITQTAKNAASSNTAAKISIFISSLAFIAALGSLLYSYQDYKGDAAWQSEQLRLLKQIRDGDNKKSIKEGSKKIYEITPVK